MSPGVHEPWGTNVWRNPCNCPTAVLPPYIKHIYIWEKSLVIWVTCNVSPNSIVIIGIAAPPPKAKIKPNSMRKASKGVENLNLK